MLQGTETEITYDHGKRRFILLGQKNSLCSVKVFDITERNSIISNSY